ncbi:MAG: hypothetical protein WC881_02970 [Elusimicrobiota bacterium]|jgi:hypothetical protein
MKHSFLLRPGRWLAQGRIFDAEHQPQAAQGEAVVEHGPAAWTIHNWLESADGRRLDNHYTVEAYAGGKAARWRAHDPALGKLKGTFEFAGRRIFAVFDAPAQGYSGSGTITQLGERSYHAQGELRRGGRVAASWDLALTRQTKP